MTYYKLWDVDVGKYLGRYDTEQEALEVAMTFVRHYGNDAANDLSLTQVADDDVVLESLSGPDLLQRIEERANQTRQTTQVQPAEANPRSRQKRRVA